MVFVTFRRCELEGRGNHGNPAILSSRSCNLFPVPYVALFDHAPPVPPVNGLPSQLAAQ
ncbi:unnamed protein product, partial [Ectocarpus sp. 6 AP-2014]